jgi:hypothetical protein
LARANHHNYLILAVRDIVPLSTARSRAKGESATCVTGHGHCHEQKYQLTSSSCDQSRKELILHLDDIMSDAILLGRRSDARSFVELHLADVTLRMYSRLIFVIGV